MEWLDTSGSSGGSNRLRPTKPDRGSAALSSKPKSAGDVYLSMVGVEKCFVEFVCVLRSKISLRPGKIVAVGDLESGATHTSVGYFADVFRAHGVRIANA